MISRDQSNGSYECYVPCPTGPEILERRCSLPTTYLLSIKSVSILPPDIKRKGSRPVKTYTHSRRGSGNLLCVVQPSNHEPFSGVDDLILNLKSQGVSGKRRVTE